MAHTTPLPIIAAPPYRRETARRHRRAVAGWIVERAARAAHGWLMHPLELPRIQHAGLAAIYGAVAIAAGATLAAVIR